MPRLTNTLTGVVVNVDDALAERLGSEWVPAAGKADPEPQEPEAKQEPKRRGRPRKTD
jgi:hypothetical protein